MIEILIGVAAVIAMIRIADAEEQSRLIWGSVTVGLMILSLLLPLPMVRVALAGILAFVAMFVYKIVANR